MNIVSLKKLNTSLHDNLEEYIQFAIFWESRTSRTSCHGYFFIGIQENENNHSCAKVLLSHLDFKLVIELN